MLHALSAVDIALWELKGKALRIAISRLLGGRFRERVQAYATGLYFRRQADSAAELAAASRRYAGEGFRAVKRKVGLDPDTDLHHAHAVRAAIGPDVGLMVDVNHAYGTTTATRLGREFERLDVRWFEEPVIPEDLEGSVAVAHALDLPITGGEAEFTLITTDGSVPLAIIRRTVAGLSPRTIAVSSLRGNNRFAGNPSLPSVNPDSRSRSIHTSSGKQCRFTQLRHG